MMLESILEHVHVHNRAVKSIEVKVLMEIDVHKTSMHIGTELVLKSILLIILEFTKKFYRINAPCERAFSVCRERQET